MTAVSDSTIVLPVTYAGNIPYYAALTQYNCITDCCVHYTKQTYANRCSIMTANGIKDLVIPVVKTTEKTKIKDIRISDHEEWQTTHIRTIDAAYRSSPFYDYFRDDFLPLYEQKWNFLIDFNTAIENKILESLGFDNITNCFSEHYIDCNDLNLIDFREVINPKKNVPLQDINIKSDTPYYQVFDCKYGFKANLSILDLLFNMGNEARIYLTNITK